MAHLDETALGGAWIAYKSDGSIDERNRLVLHYTSLVRYVATKVAAGLPNMVDRDDLVSYGVFGLIDAIEKFDPEKGVKFETYAVSRIRGGIMDELRKLDWVPRSVRSKARQIETTRRRLEHELGRMPDDAEIASELQIPTSELWSLVSQVEMGAVGGLTENEHDDDRMSVNESAFDPMGNPEDQFLVDDVVRLLAKAVSTMSQRAKTIVALYYIQGMTLAEIGEVLGVTESRVCQLQSGVLSSIGDSLRHGSLAVA